MAVHGEGFRAAVEEALERYPLLAEAGDAIVTQAPLVEPQEGAIPQPLQSAMRYSLLLPGKRLRPVLLLAAYALMEEDWQEALPFACALEMIHTYSLVHDDLPALDNDPLRRGKPTNHRVFGENMAILAGDGLLNLAYETMLCAPLSERKPAEALAAMREIALRAGVRGMIAGQALDVKLEGMEPREGLVRYIHRHKTADLVAAPIVAGLSLAGATQAQVASGRKYGENLGLAFQIVDDLLDIVGDTKTLGKQTGMDATRGKMTWPSVRGVDQSRKDAGQAVEAAVNALETFGSRADFLRDLAQEMLVRVK